MKLKPGLFQLIVVLMTSSLLVACNTYPQGSQVDCNNPAAKQSKDCNSSSGGSVGRRVYSGSGNSHGQGSSQVDSQGNSSGGSHSTSKTGRGGFGSFGRGSSGG
jgi:hypothetical protein